MLHQPALQLPDFALVEHDGARVPVRFEHPVSIPRKPIVPVAFENVRMKVGCAVMFRDDGTLVKPTGYLYKDPEPARPTGPLDETLNVRGKRIHVCYNAGWRNHYHSMLQGAFSTWLATTFFDDGGEIYLFPQMPPRQTALLELAGAPPDRTVFLDRNLEIRLNEAVTLATTYTTRPERPSSLLPLFGRDLMRKLGARTAGPRKIYVSRRDSKNRVMSNEAELEEVMRQKGFTVLELSRHPMVEQMEFFASADLIVAPHGAGLTNLIFSRPGTKVMELTSDKYVNPCFIDLSQVMGVEHAVHVFPYRGEASVPNHKEVWTANIEIVANEVDKL